MNRSLGLAVLLVTAGCASPPMLVEPTATVTTTERPREPVQTPLPYALTCAQGITPEGCVRRASEIVDTGTTPRGTKQVVSLVISIDSWTITYNDGTAMTTQE